MKFTVNGYEIDIKVKRGGDSRYNKDRTLSFMNEMAIWMGQAASYKNFERRDDRVPWTDSERETSKRCAEYLNEAWRDLYHQLEEYGAYDNLK